MRRAPVLLAVAAAAVAIGTAAARGQGAAPPERALRLLNGLRGATPVQCELGLQMLQGWWGWGHAPVPDRDPQAWALVSWAARGRVDPASVPVLAAALKDQDGCVRRAAARMLGRSRLPAARARLLEALRDPDPVQRRLGATGLGFSDDKSVVPLLERHLGDRDPGVRAAVAWAMGAVY